MYEARIYPFGFIPTLRMIASRQGLFVAVYITEVGPAHIPRGTDLTDSKSRCHNGAHIRPNAILSSLASLAFERDYPVAANQRARLIDTRMSPEPYHHELVLAANAQRNCWRQSADRPPRTYRAEAPGGTELRRRTQTEGGRAFSESAILRNAAAGDAAIGLCRLPVDGVRLVSNG